MTKMKSKKMTKSTFAIIIMAIAMVAMLAFGGTYAYFTATANNATGSTQTALIKLTNSTADLTIVKPNTLPGETVVDETITLTDGSTRDTYIFAKVTVKFGTQTVDITDDSILTIVADADWKEAISEAGVFAIKNTAGTTSVGFDIKVALSEDLDENYVQGESTDDGMTYMNKAVSVTIQFASAQADGFESAQDAYDNSTVEFAAIA